MLRSLQQELESFKTGDGVQPVNTDNKQRTIQTYTQDLNTYREGRKRPVQGFTVVTPDQVRKHREALYKRISESGLSPASINKHLLAMHFFVRSGPKGLPDDHPFVVKISKETTDRNKASEVRAGDNKQTIQKRIDNPVVFQGVLDYFDDLKLRFDELTNKEHMNFITLAFSGIYHEPLRGQEIQDMLLVNESEIPAEKRNFLVRRANGTRYMLLRKFKTDRHYPNEEAIIDLNREANALVNLSLNKLPRQYLLCLPTNPDKPIGYATWLRNIKELNEGFSADTLRSARAIAFFNRKVRPTVNETEELAKKMLTSVKELRLRYDKINEVHVEKKLGRVSKPIVVEESVSDDARKLLDRKAKRQEYQRQYYAKNSEKIKQQSRDALLARGDEAKRVRLLKQLRDERRAGIVSTVREATLRKYGISEDDITG